jgi:hypothetical protein
MWPKLSSNISLPLTTLTLIILFSEILKNLRNYFFKLKKVWKELLNFQEYSIYWNEYFKINSNDNWN